MYGAFLYNNIIGQYSNLINHDWNFENFSVVEKKLSKKFTYFENDKNNIIELRFPIEFFIETDENGFYYINKKYNLYVFGETQKEVESKIYDEFLRQYEFYAKDDDVNLDNNAKKLKYDLLSVYGGISA